ncbi:hypothetical protein [Oligoflexus tunisiensis]|uniref:hypothetical protein n=1 Tax=Oligoflexus tunisiensis TaxID=708132 RepID=UPI00114D2827|nr:hypothetical protein [Oligoflexus tunisiensis]
MRIITLGLILVSVACAQAPQPVKSTAGQPAKATTPTTQAESVQDAVAAEQPAPAAVPDQISASDVAEVMTTANPPADGAMDMVAMEQQVQTIFAQSNLSPEQSAAMSEKTMALIAAANAGDQEAVTELSNDLAKEAIGKAIFGGFGLVDAAGVVAAIMDLIAAVMDLDVAGIIDALMDLVAALGA